MTSKPHSRFPAWTNHQTNSMVWVTPMDSKNTHLQQGRFRGLSLQSLRPMRDATRQPITYGTADGKLRGLVKTASGYRHIDVTAAHAHGARVNVHPWPTGSRRADESWYGIQERRVAHVRAVRLRVLMAEPGGAPWMPAGASAATAAEEWDSLLREIYDLIPTTHRAQMNPWCWVHHLAGEI